VKNFALELENVEKYFPRSVSGWRAFVHPVSQLMVPALRGISLQVEPGQVLGIVGANGA
jgi:ABC-type multidrug transport system ATPase subunit